MELIAVSDKVRKVLEDFVPGEELSAKLESLTRANLKHLLTDCNDVLGRFEAKHGLTFSEFAQAWQEGAIPNTHSHEVERDFMEWESYQQEKEDLLAALIHTAADYASFQCTLSIPPGGQWERRCIA